MLQAMLSVLLVCDAAWLRNRFQVVFRPHLRASKYATCSGFVCASVRCEIHSVLLECLLYPLSV